VKATGDFKAKDGSTTASGSIGETNGNVIADGKLMHKFGTTDVIDATGSLDAQKKLSLGADETHTFADGGTLKSTADLVDAPTPQGGSWTGSLDEAYKSKDGKTQLDGSIARTSDAWKAHLSGTGNLSPDLSLTGAADYSKPDAGKGQGTFSLTETSKGPKLVQSVQVDGGVGDRDYLNAKGTLDAQLAPNWYAGAWGGATVESGKQTDAQAGASVTFTPSEKSALTLAGVIDQHGTIETRLQYDMFKTKLDGVSDLADHKKDAMVSLFLSYKNNAAGPEMMDDRYGAPDYNESAGMGGGQVMAGVKISF
jgi:hypothetical protein